MLNNGSDTMKEIPQRKGADKDTRTCDSKKREEDSSDFRNQKTVTLLSNKMSQHLNKRSISYFSKNSQDR